ncbi:hypothetical protein ABZ569_20720 [Streptomyces albus]|uniref:hypothetical protein n=1 Tax=Streptomyces albus TaxID=1888 RepID=UPI0033E316EE
MVLPYVWPDFSLSFPSVEAAIVSSCQKPVHVVIDHGQVSLRRALMASTADDAVLVDTIYAAGDVQRLLATCYTTDRDCFAATSAALMALETLLPPGSDWQAFERIVEPAYPGLPLFGYRLATPLAPGCDWGQVNAATDIVRSLWYCVISKRAFPHPLGRTPRELLGNLAHIVQMTRPSERPASPER